MSYGRDEDHGEKPITWLDVERAEDDLAALKKLEQEMHELLNAGVNRLRTDFISKDDLEYAHGYISDMFGDALYSINKGCSEIINNFDDGYQREVRSYWMDTRL